MASESKDDSEAILLLKPKTKRFACHFWACIVGYSQISIGEGGFMARHLVVANGALMRLIWTAGGAIQQINVLGFSHPAGTPITQTLANAMGVATKAALTSSGLAPLLQTSTALANIGLRDVNVASQVEFLDSGAPVSGSGVTDTLPRGVALVVTLRTALAGPSYRGRVYLGGFTETENSPAGQASTALVNAAGSFISAISSAATSNGLTLCVMSRPAEARTETIVTTHSDGTTSTKTKQHAARPGGVTPVTLIQVRNNVWDSQRRRTLVGSGSTLLSQALFSHSVQSV